MSTTITRWHLRYINEAKNSRKFYKVFTGPDTNGHHVVVFHWGRIGTTGQSDTHRFGTEREAMNTATTKVYDKLRKGYEEYEERISYDADPASIGSPQAAEAAYRRASIKLKDKGALADARALTDRATKVLAGLQTGEVPIEDALDEVMELEQELDLILDELESTQMAVEIARTQLNAEILGVNA